MRHIVVPTDFSDCAMSALKVAVKIADKIDAKISLVHTYAVPVYGFTSGQLMYDGVALGKIKAEIEEELDKIAKSDLVKGRTVEKLLLPEYSVDQITEHEHLKGADLIVMGTHGTSGWQEDVIGSNTEKIIRRSDSPVLIVREGSEEDFSPKKMVFASTFFGEVFDRFPRIKGFAELFQMDIHLVHINTPNDFMTTEYSENLMTSFKEQFNLNDATINIYNDETVEDGVINFAHRIGADLVALETHGRTGINHLLRGSIAEDVANHIDLPVLTFKIKEAPKARGVIFPVINR